MFNINNTDVVYKKVMMNKTQGGSICIDNFKYLKKNITSKEISRYPFLNVLINFHKSFSTEYSNENLQAF